MTSFNCFQGLPPELRMQIWREHLIECHGTQIHVFLSRPPDADRSLTPSPQCVNLDVTTHEPGYNTLGAAMISPESWAVFKELFHVGDTGCLSPQNKLLDAGGRLVDYNPSSDQSGLHGGSLRAVYAAAAQEELRRQSVRFAIKSERDIVYIIDEQVQPLFRALCSSSWMPNVKRVAFQVLNFQRPQPPTRLDRWAQWDYLLSDPSPDVRRFFSNPALKDVLLVIVPNKETQTTNLKPNLYGFVVVDPEFYVLGPSEEGQAVRRHFVSICLRMFKVFPDLRINGKVGCVVDAIPSRSKFCIY
ncbi:hypothetical protein F5B18DRAFT_604851 [Nemania serpens]|nr:hypothetical protein F5B18DRAFT_604851 [Nemania serpens]